MANPQPAMPTTTKAPVAAGADLSAEFIRAVSASPKVKLKATVITAADKAYFLPLQCLVTSVKASHDCRMVVFNLGLDVHQVRWLELQGCEVRTVDVEQLDLPTSYFLWQSWNKPFFIKQIQGPVIWLDADCIVTGSLAWLDANLQERPVMFAETVAIHFNGWEEGSFSLLNEPELYDYYPVPVENRFGQGESPNAGVLAFDTSRERDKTILSVWCWLISQVVQDSRLSETEEKQGADQSTHGWIHWHDQGALIWALEKTGETFLVLPIRRFNDALSIDPLTLKGPDALATLIMRIMNLKGVSVVHFPSGLKPYQDFPANFDPDVRWYELWKQS